MKQSANIGKITIFIPYQNASRDMGADPLNRGRNQYHIS